MKTTENTNWRPCSKSIYRTEDLESRPYIEGESVDGIFIPMTFRPTKGGMIIRHVSNHDDQFYITKEYFNRNFS